MSTWTQGLTTEYYTLHTTWCYRRQRRSYWYLLTFYQELPVMLDTISCHQHNKAFSCLEFLQSTYKKLCSHLFSYVPELRWQYLVHLFQASWVVCMFLPSLARDLVFKEVTDVRCKWWWWQATALAPEMKEQVFWTKTEFLWLTTREIM